MITIIHGENHSVSRKKLTDLISQAKTKKSEIQTLDAKNLDLAKLETALTANYLFTEEKLLIIEDLHSLPRSKKKDNFIKLIAKAEINIILWEKKQLTKTNLKKFPDAQVFEFKISQKLWSFLDQISPDKKTKKKQLTLLQEVKKNEDPIFIMIMLARQIRMLIKAKDGGTLKGAPFMISKIKKQAQKFTMKQLLAVHKQLQELDEKIKKSELLLELGDDLDLLIINM